MLRMQTQLQCKELIGLEGNDRQHRLPATTYALRTRLLVDETSILYYVSSFLPERFFLLTNRLVSGEHNPRIQMSKHAKTICGFRGTLSALLTGGHTRTQLHQFVHQCNSIAITLIQSKIASGAIDVRRFGLSPSDIAFDAIADLFREDDDGILVQIKAYFESIDWEKSEDEELAIHLRRLVFMRTNQGLFRMYQEVDPGLGKILRNTKLAIAALNTFVEMDHFGEPCIAPSLCDPLARLPMLDRDMLERCMLEMTNGSERIPDLLAKLSRYLREQKEHSRMVPIMWVAIGIRSVYGRVEVEQHQDPQVEQQLVEDEAQRMLKEACARVKARNEQKYVSFERLSKDAYEKYFQVIERILVKRLLSNDGHDVSLFKLLQECLPSLSREEYNTTHKAKIEYLARLAEEKAVGMLKKNFS